MKKRLIGMAMAAVLAMTALTGCGTAEYILSRFADLHLCHLSPEPALYRGKGGRHFHKSLCG
ncbi:MAG: hypothetical protein ACLUD9_02665 [Anaerotignum faecicola]